MITSVTKIKEGVYKINDAVIISNITCDEQGINCDINRDEALLTEKESIELAQQFINESLETMLKD